MEQLTLKELNNLVIKAQRGEERAFSQIYEATYLAQYYTAFSILKYRDVAEDAVQIAYIKAYENLHNLARSEFFLPWLSRITYNSCLNIRRKQDKSISNLNEDLVLNIPDYDLSSNPLETAMQREKQAFISEMLTKLSEEHREVIIFRYFHNLKIKEIAEIMDCSVGTTKSRIHYALKQLRSVLKEEGYSESAGLPGLIPGTLFSLKRYCKSLSGNKTIRTAGILTIAGGILIGLNTLFTPTVLTGSAHDKDLEPPIIEDCSISDNIISLQFHDELSGVDYNSIRLENSDGNLVPIKSVVPDSGILTLACPADSIFTIKLRDRAGNEQIFDVTLD